MRQAAGRLFALSHLVLLAGWMLSFPFYREETEVQRGQGGSKAMKRGGGEAVWALAAWPPSTPDHAPRPHAPSGRPRSRPCFLDLCPVIVLLLFCFQK